LNETAPVGTELWCSFESGNWLQGKSRFAEINRKKRREYSGRVSDGSAGVQLAIADGKGMKATLATDKLNVTI